MANKKEEIAVKESTSVDVRRGAPRGMENVDVNSITIPTAKVLQPTSPETQDDDYNFKAGQIIHSLFMEQLPEVFVPISIADTNTLFVPKNDADKMVLKNKVKERFGVELTEEEMKGMFICRAQDGRNGDKFGKCAECRLNKFDGNDKPLCTANINVLALFEGQETPVVVRFSNTSYKHGKKLKDLIFLSRQDVFSRKYKLIPTKISKDGNNWYEAVVKPAGKPTDGEFKEAEAIWESFRNVNIDFDESDGTPMGEDVIDY